MDSGKKIEQNIENANWSKVSHVQVGRSVEKQAEIRVVGTPSHFSILEEDEGEKEADEAASDSDEGEIVEDEKEVQEKEHQVERIIRVLPPRASKGPNKSFSESLSQKTKENLPSVSSRRKPNKP